MYSNIRGLWGHDKQYFTTNQKEYNHLFVDEATCHVKRGRFFLLFAVTLYVLQYSL